MWVVYIVIIMFIGVLVKCCYESVYGKSNETCTKPNVDKEIECYNDTLSKKGKPRISPPVHSMLELMMKQPEEFENVWDEHFEGETWRHKRSSTSFTKCTSWSGDIEYCYINMCSITNEEGKYLQQGVSFIESYKKSVRESKNKKDRYEVDREIRKVLEEI